MNTWDLDFGMVKHWDDFNFKHETVQMKIKYDANSDMPVKIDYIDDGKIVGTALSIDLNVKEVQSPYGNIEICGEIYTFTEEQIALIKSVMSYWKCQVDNDTQKISNGTEIHVGLVLHYDANTHEYVLSDLEINRTTPITMRIKEYDLTTKMATNLIMATCEQWESSFVNHQDDYLLYSICGHMFLLNDSQANNIDCLL